MYLSIFDRIEFIWLYLKNNDFCIYFHNLQFIQEYTLTWMFFVVLWYFICFISRISLLLLCNRFQYIKNIKVSDMNIRSAKYLQISKEVSGTHVVIFLSQHTNTYFINFQVQKLEISYPWRLHDANSRL